MTMVQLSDFVPFQGEHCETNTTGNLLNHCGLALSEPMLYGLGEGLAFGVMNFKGMPAPFIGGRPRPEDITKTLAQHLALQVDFRKTSSKKKAWRNVATFVDAGQPVGVRIDAYFLDYFTTKIHFGGHYVAVHGYDADYVYVVDTQQQGTQLKTDRARFEEGRLWRGPMAPSGISWTITCSETEIDWARVLRTAIVNNAQSYLNPPIRNFGIKGIRKAATEIPKWFHTIENAPDALAQIGMLMERAGTGGALFRNFYRDFLAEANVVLQSDLIAAAHKNFAEAAPLWSQVATLLMQLPVAGDTKLTEITASFEQLAALEEAAVMHLAQL